MTASNDVDLDALAPQDKRVKLDGQWYKLPGDMPMPLFLRIQAFESRVEKGESEVAMLAELSDELLALFQRRQPTMTVLPEIGVLTLLQSLGAIYGGATPGEAQPSSTLPPKKRTPSSTGRRAPATSR